MITFRVGERATKNIGERDRTPGFGGVHLAPRSTLPLIDYRRDPGPRLAHLATGLRLSLAPPVNLAFEVALRVAQGRGKESFTDLMITGATAAVAIEAKYTEPRYPTVGQWLGTAPTTHNREAVLAGWLAHIGAGTGTPPPLSASAVLDLPYQLIHRTASVCTICQSRRVPGVSATPAVVLPGRPAPAAGAGANDRPVDVSVVALGPSRWRAWRS